MGAWAAGCEDTTPPAPVGPQGQVGQSTGAEPSFAPKLGGPARFSARCRRTYLDTFY